MNSDEQVMNDSDLRKFGLLTGLLLVVFFDGLIPWLWDFTPPLWPVFIAVLLSVPALVYPRLLLPVYRAWMAFANVLGWINTRIILTVIFFVVFVPVGIALRIFRDPMCRELDADIESYRISSKPPQPENMERPF